MKLKTFIYKILYYSGINYIYSIFYGNKLYLVMYHSISSKVNSDTLLNKLYSHISLDIEQFEKQIKYLKEHDHTFINFDDIPNIKSKNIKKPTIIYFDDGLKDVMINALPILEKYKVPATIFLVSGILDKTNMIWTIQYKNILNKENVNLKEQNALIEKIKSENESYRFEIMKKYSIGDEPYLFDIFLNWDDVRNLMNKGISFGSHGVTHSRLNEVDQDRLIYDIKFSKERIEKETGMSICAFSLPHSRVNETVKSQIYNYGYKYLVSAGSGLNNIDGSSFLKNISPKSSDSIINFVNKINILNIFK